METKIIARVNNVDIVSTSDEQMVPIRPICEALGIAYERQTTKIKEHPILSSTVTLRVMVAADGKQREMLCLPLEFIFGWLFTINPANVNEDAKPTLISLQCLSYIIQQMRAASLHFRCRHFLCPDILCTIYGIRVPPCGALMRPQHLLDVISSGKGTDTFILKTYCYA